MLLILLLLSHYTLSQRHQEAVLHSVTKHRCWYIIKVSIPGVPKRVNSLYWVSIYMLLIVVMCKQSYENDPLTGIRHNCFESDALIMIKSFGRKSWILNKYVIRKFILNGSFKWLWYHYLWLNNFPCRASFTGTCIELHIK